MYPHDSVNPDHAWMLPNYVKGQFDVIAAGVGVEVKDDPSDMQDDHKYL